MSPRTVGVSSERWSDEEALHHQATLLQRRVVGGQASAGASANQPGRSRSGSTGSSDGRHLAEKAWSGWGRTWFIPNGCCCPLGAQPSTRQPQRGETESDPNTPGPLGVRVCQESGMGSQSLGWVVGGGA